MINYSKLTDESLVELCKANDETAWSVLVNKYMRRVIFLAWQFASDDSSIFNDLVSDGICFGLIGAVAAFDRTKGRFSTFAVRCIQNAMKNCICKLWNVSHGSKNDTEQLSLLPNAANVKSTPEDNLQLQTTIEAVEKYMKESLSQNEYKAYSLKLMGYSYDSIAQKLSITKRGAHAAVYRAQNKIRSYFDFN